jgi:hypothetical protein
MRHEFHFRVQESWRKPVSGENRCRIDRGYLEWSASAASDRRAYEAADQYLRAVFLIPDLS